jgi:hypothetical protein
MAATASFPAATYRRQTALTSNTAEKNATMRKLATSSSTIVTPDSGFGWSLIMEIISTVCTEIHAYEGKTPDATRKSRLKRIKFEIFALLR